MGDDAGGLSATQADVLELVVNEIIPPSADGRLPGAGELGIARGIAASLDAGSRAQLAADLETLDRLARVEGSDRFVALAPARRTEVLRKMEIEAPAFVSGLLFQICVAYYQHPRVHEGLGRDPRPPFPKGYELASFDASLLADVRDRPKPYREA